MMEFGVTLVLMLAFATPFGAPLAHLLVLRPVTKTDAPRAVSLQFALTDLYVLLTHFVLVGVLIFGAGGEVTFWTQYLEQGLLWLFPLYWWFMGMRSLGRRGISSAWRRTVYLGWAAPCAYALATLLVVLAAITGRAFFDLGTSASSWAVCDIWEGVVGLLAGGLILWLGVYKVAGWVATPRA